MRERVTAARATTKPTPITPLTHRRSRLEVERECEAFGPPAPLTNVVEVRAGSVVSGDSVATVWSNTVDVEAASVTTLAPVTVNGVAAPDVSAGGSTRIVAGPMRSCVGIASRAWNS